MGFCEYERNENKLVEALVKFLETLTGLLKLAEKPLKEQVNRRAN